MGKQYHQLSMAERVSIMLRLRDGWTSRAIARALERAPSTITREIERHRRLMGCAELPYEATRAAARAHVARFKRRRPRKLDLNGKLFTPVRRALGKRLSPDPIAGRLRREHPGCHAWNVSHETIYTALYALPRGALRRELVGYLRQGHVNRWPRSRGANRKHAGFLSEEVLIHVRPPEVTERLVPGHWEGDFLKGAANRSAVGTWVERTSRCIVLARRENGSSLAALTGFRRALTKLAPTLRETLTYDRGGEMARHRELTQRTGVKVYFADPHSPWQRGSNENANGLIREYLPKGEDLSPFTQRQLKAIANALNDRPRRILDYQTPREVFTQLLALEQAKLPQNNLSH
jgi:IS30 family transposase